MVDEHVTVCYRVSVMMAVLVTVVITDTQQGTYVCCLIRSKLYTLDTNPKQEYKQRDKQQKEKNQTYKVSRALSRPEIGNRGGTSIMHSMGRTWLLHCHKQQRRQTKN